MSNLKIKSLGLDDDTIICWYDCQDINTFIYRYFINMTEGCTFAATHHDFDEHDNDLDNPIPWTIDFFLNWILGGIPGENMPTNTNGACLSVVPNVDTDQIELDRFLDLSNDLRETYIKEGGILVSWTIEGDDNLALIYGGTNKEIMDWLYRPYDESEFED